jgi:hypothetical protein
MRPGSVALPSAIIFAWEMSYKKQNSRGKGEASHQGGSAHKLLSKEERDERRLESSQGKGHVLRKLQDQIRAASGKEEQGGRRKP